MIGALPAGPLPWLFGAVVLLAGALLWSRHTAPAPQAAPAPGCDRG